MMQGMTRPTESTQKNRIAMCPPTHFGVEYVINPWMTGNVGAVDTAAAGRQWEALHRILSERAQVTLLEPAPHLPDMCFVANAGLVLEDRVVPSVFRVTQRAPEVPIVTRFFESLDLTVIRLHDEHSFEGEGDALFQPGEALLWAGYGVRSALGSHVRLTESFRVTVESLRLVDERFYHLDTCFCPLLDGHVMYYPAAFDERSLRRIHDRVPVDKRIEVDTDDALGFCCNAVRVDRTLVMNHASPELARKLESLGYEVVTTKLSEFMKSGGAAKCLTLHLDQNVPASFSKRPRVESPIRSVNVEVRGHLLDGGYMNRVLDAVTDPGGSFRIEQFSAGLRRDQPSIARLRISAPEPRVLDEIVDDLGGLGGTVLGAPSDARLEPAPADGVAPEAFYSTTIYPTEVRVDGEWVRVTGQRMDVVIVVDRGSQPTTARCVLIRDLKEGDEVVCGTDGVVVQAPETAARSEGFAFMSAGVSSERRVERVVEELAWEMRRIKARGGRTVVVAGPVVVHTGGGTHLGEIVRGGYVQALLTGNALPVHDIELALFGTSLGIDLRRGVGVRHGHQHHLRAINRVRGAGSIGQAVEQGIVQSGIMYECVKAGVECVLAGSIRDDGPLPDTIMDLTEAQAAYARALEGAELVLMLSSMLHAIGTGNMTPAGVKLVCVDISPAVVTKLADRGSVESLGVVTDVGLFLALLAQRLR